MSDFSRRLLPTIKKTLRETSTEFDDEILGYIDTCVADLKNAGILNSFFDTSMPGDIDSQILQAVRWYCLSVYGLYNSDMEKYQRAYASLKSTLSTLAAYTKDSAQLPSPTLKEIYDAIRKEIEEIDGRVRDLEEEEEVSDSLSSIYVLKAGETSANVPAEADIVIDPVKSLLYVRNASGVFQLVLDNEGVFSEGSGEHSAVQNKDNIAQDSWTSALNKDTEAYGGGSLAGGGGSIAGISLAKYKEIFAKQLTGKSDEEIAQLYAKARERDTCFDGEIFDTIGFKYWFATVFGERNEAWARAAFAEGYGNDVMNDYAHGEGYVNKIRGVAAHGEGGNNEVDAMYAHVEGESNHIYKDARAARVGGLGNHVYAPYADVGGRGNTVAKGAEGTFVRGGWNTITDKGKYSNIHGQFNEADASMVYIEGLNNKAKHTRVHIEGQNNESSAANQHILGKYSKKNASAAVIVGGGTGEAEELRKNIYELDWNGNAKFGGKVSCSNPELPEHAATKSYVDTNIVDRLAKLVSSAPATLDTLAEIAKALGDDPNFATTILTQLGEKADSAVVAKELAEKENKYINPAKNLFDASVIDQDGLYGSDGTISFSPWGSGGYIGDSVTTEVPFSAICPEAVIGKTYTLSYKGGKGDLRDGTITPSGTFELTLKIYRSGLIITSALADDGAAGQPSGADFYDIMLNEGAIALPYEPFSTTKDLHGQLEYLEEKIDSNSNGKLDKITIVGSPRVYGISSSGSQTIHTLTPIANANTIAYHTDGGALNVGKAVADTNAVPLAQMNEALSDKASTKTVNTLSKKIENIEAGTASDAFIVDDSVAYSKTVPADVASYAEILDVGGMTYLPENMPPDLSVLVTDHNGYDVRIDEGNGRIYVGVPPTQTFYTTTAPFSEIFKDAEVGKTYMLTFEVGGETGGFLALGKYPNQPDTNRPFVLTDEIYNNGIDFYNDMIDTDAGLYADTAYFYNIKLTEIGGSARYAKVTEVVSMDISGNVLGTLHIPVAVQALEGYGKTDHRIVWDKDNGKAYWVTPDQNRTDISAYFTDDNLIAVQSQGTIRMVNAEGLRVPSTIVYRKRGF